MARPPRTPMPSDTSRPRREAVDRVRRHIRRGRKLEEAFRKLKDAQVQLVHSEKMASLGQLVAGVAHEINNPVSFIYGGAGLLEANVRGLRQYLDACEQALGPKADAIKAAHRFDAMWAELEFLTTTFKDGATRIRDIVRDLRKFSRQDAYEYSEVDLAQCLESTHLLVHALYRDYVTFHLHLQSVPSITGSEGPLNQVFMNLLVNACQAIESKGDVWIKLWSDDSAVKVEIRDSGVGIPEDVRPHIFEPFFTTKPIGTGTGMGLSIVHSIIQKHHGRIEVESAPGQGTCFRLNFPAHGSDIGVTVGERAEP